MKKIIVILLVFAFGCNKSSEQRSMGFADEYQVEASEALNEPAEIKSKEIQPGQQVERMLIKKGNVEFEAKNLDEISSKIKVATKKYDAYASKENEYKSTERISRNVIIRMPSKHFDVFLADISEGVAYFDSKSIDVSDVTEEFLDVQARLKTKKELELRYLQLLNKANKVSEILEIEREMGSLRSDIESIEGRLNYLKDQAAVSTLNITFYTKVSQDNRFWSKVKDGFGNGWNFLLQLILGIINIWPVWILGFGLFWVVKRVRNR